MIVTIQGHGTFDVSEEHLPRLLAFLSSVSGVKTEESNTVNERTDAGFTGRQLLI
jgi:hypothetical protein